MPPRIAARVALAVVVLGTIGCDRVTKHVATIALAGKPDRPFLADTIRVGYMENPGAFLSLGENLPEGVRSLVFTAGNGLMLAALLLLALRRKWDEWAALGLALFFAGGVSNWIDRAVSGRVVDFLNVGVGPLRTGVFNVADVAIMFGAGLFALVEFRKR